MSEIALSAEQKMARKIAAKFELTPPVDVQSIINNYANYEEAVLPKNVDAICIIKNDKPLVIVDPTQPQVRKRFTLAHELGHLVIPWHYGMISCHIDKEDLVDDTLYTTMETEANNFAAELLMPTSWLCEMAEAYLHKGLDYTLHNICYQAEVSLSAAFFSFFKVLPADYVAYVKNNNRKHGKRFGSTETALLIPKQDDMIDFEWLNNCATDRNEYQMDSFIIWWWKLEKNISATELVSLMENVENTGLSHVLSTIATQGRGTLASTFFNIVEKLPTGFVLLIEGGDYRRIFYSPGTNVPVPTLHPLRTKRWLREYSNESGYVDIHGYRISWWKFVVEAPNHEREEDKRHSKVIIKEILNDSFSDDKERTHCSFVINGIIGSLNNRQLDTYDEFYQAFKLRLIGEERLKKMLTHPKLEDFINNKIIELLQRRQNK